MKQQAMNPFLPLNSCIPDGEPHVFGGRVYLYGSHDREGGTRFCELPYEVWSAPVNDLSDWRCDGVSFRPEWDPSYPQAGTSLFAPDVVQGNDGRYYLYYALSGNSFTAPIHVAVSDTPAGPFAYYGVVQNPDGSALTENITFDPAIFNDNGRIRLYYGWALDFDPEKLKHRTPEFEEQLVQAQVMLFGKPEVEVRNSKDGIMGANEVELADDMLTVQGPVHRIVPGQSDADGTSFFGHAFFEGSSMRKIGDTYYFIYSSQWQHELCYATSQYPDRDFTFGGVLISNGDIGINGRTAEKRLAATGNNHGSVEYINGQWYVFYHRQTHKNSFNRKACAEKINLLPDGRFVQAEMTSCGLNGSPLVAQGTYSAAYACELTNGHMPHIGGNDKLDDVPFPYQANEGNEHFIADIDDNTAIGYRYFVFAGKTRLTLTVRGAAGRWKVLTDAAPVCELTQPTADGWTKISTTFTAEGTHALRLIYHGSGKAALKDITLEKAE